MSSIASSLAAPPSERRRHRRTPVGLRVRVHFRGRTIPATAELTDVSPAGCYVRGVAAPAQAKLALGFVGRKDRVCLAAGQVLRVDPDGFAVKIHRANAAFMDFVADITDYASFEAA